VLGPRKGTTDPDVMFLKGKDCAFLGRRARVTCADGQLRSGSYTMRLGLTAVVNRQVKRIQVPKPINLRVFIISECKGGYGEGLNKCKLFSN
jgi:hypothetical protein